jgi:hypothetical protein
LEDGDGGGVEAVGEGANEEDEDKGGDDDASFGSSRGTSRLEISSPSWARSAMILPTGMPLVPFCACEKCDSSRHLMQSGWFKYTHYYSSHNTIILGLHVYSCLVRFLQRDHLDTTASTYV